MAKPSGSGGGKPDKGGGGGGGGTAFAILGLDNVSDSAGDGDETNDVTSLSTGFVIEGTIDKNVLTDPNFSLTVLLNGVERPADEFIIVINDETGDWTYTYTGDDLSGTVTVDASYTYTHPKNGKLQTKNAEPYPFEIDSGASNSPAFISGDAVGAVSEDGTLSDSGILTVADPDSDEDALQAVAATGDNGYGSFDVQAGGTWTYTLTNSHADIQALAAGATLDDTITVTSEDGTDTQVITVTITGTNDVPLITGATSGGVSEDDTTSTGGTLTVNDTDTGQSALQAVTDGVGDGQHGTFAVQSNGVWTYALNNGDTAVQALAEGATLTDTLIVLSADGTPSAITVTITGTNDVPVITGDTTGGASEDGTLTATGFLVASDPDTNESNFQPQTDTVGVFGTFSINSTGGWSYSLDNTAVQGLSADETRQETFDVTSFDGTGTETVTITITGTNDIPTITGATTGNVTEDGTLSATGVLTVADADAGESLALSVAAGTASLGGYGTYQVLSDGTWTYTLDNSHADVQALITGQTMMDTFTVTSADGITSETVTVTINGANEEPLPPPPPPPPADSFTPTDDLYSEQWHLAMLGDIEAIWAEFTGTGVHVGIYDDGIEYDHIDLNDNYIDMTGAGLPDPYPTTSSEAKHGTAVAGVIAAEANGVGSVGVAFDASISSVNIFSGAADINNNPTGFLDASDKQYLFDIVNHSWGSAPVFLNDTTALTQGILEDWDFALANGRGGLGTIIVKAAGNDADTAQGDFLNAVRASISVAAYDSDGDASWYTNRGANVLVSAPSSGKTILADAETGELHPSSNLRITTTDRQGSFGYADDPSPGGDWSSSDNLSGFGGTSSAAPTVSGVVALMLDANEGLGWRDVQNILAYSAHHVGGEVGVVNTDTETVPESWIIPGGDPNTNVTVPVEYFDWFYNGANNWNGGGLHFSEDYGFGGVDAYNAVRMAEVWTLFDPAQTSLNEVTAGTGAMSPGLSVSGNGDTAQYQFTYSGDAMSLDYVDISVLINTTLMQEISLDITSPDGTTVTLMDLPINDYTPAFDIFGIILATVNVSWTFGANAFKGEDPNGVWTVTLTEKDVTFDIDNYGSEADGNILSSLSLDFFGSAVDENDVYHYTSEILTLGFDGDASRVSLDDSGGIDWFDFAATGGNIVSDMSAGGTTTLNGFTIVQTTAGTVIENAVSGDGNDTLLGNDAANELHGMRGNDTLDGGFGSDTLWGGTGDDMFVYYDGDGADWIGDFTAGLGLGDTIALHASTGFLDFGNLSFTDLGDDVRVDLGGGDEIVLAGVYSTGLLAEDDFVFFT